MAKPRVFVREFQGPEASEARKAVGKLLQKRFGIVPTRSYEATATELGASKNTKENMVRVATHVGADAIVFGKVTRKGKRKSELQITVREGATGKLLSRIEVPWTDDGLSKKDRRQTDRKLALAVKDARPAQGKRDRSEDDDDLFGSDAPAAGSSDDDEPDATGVVGSLETQRKGGVIRLDTGASQRRLSFTYRSGLDTRPWGYTGAPAGMGGVSGEYVLPLGLGVYGNYAQSFGMSARLDNGTQPVARLSQVEYAAGALYRKHVGRVFLEGSVAYNTLVFAIERRQGVDFDIPDVQYTYLDPGLRLGFTSGRLHLAAGARYLHVTSAGPMTAQANYGGGKIMGGQGEATVAFDVTDSLVVQAGATYTLFAFIFDGTGQKAHHAQRRPRPGRRRRLRRLLRRHRFPRLHLLSRSRLQ